MARCRCSTGEIRSGSPICSYWNPAEMWGTHTATAHHLATAYCARGAGWRCGHSPSDRSWLRLKRAGEWPPAQDRMDQHRIRRRAAGGDALRRVSCHPLHAGDRQPCIQSSPSAAFPNRAAGRPRRCRLAVRHPRAWLAASRRARLSEGDTGLHRAGPPLRGPRRGHPGARCFCAGLLRV